MYIKKTLGCIQYDSSRSTPVATAAVMAVVVVVVVVVVAVIPHLYY
jgi:membrane protein YdbS with pleckstrin-like domain